MLFDEAPSSDRRSIPPVSRPTPPTSDGRSGWIPILLATSIAGFALAATHVHRGVTAQGALTPGFATPRPVLITEAARQAVADTAPGHRMLARQGALVPRSAVVDVRGTPTVFVTETDFRFVATPVVLGEETEDGQRILSGIAVGQVVVSDGAEALKAHLTL